MQQADQFLFSLEYGFAFDGGRCGRGMAAASKIAGNDTDIHFRDPAAAYEVEPLSHADKSKDYIQVFHDHHPAHKHGKIIFIVRQGQFAYGNAYGLDGVGGGVFQQFAQ